MQLTQKEISLIKDLKDQEQLCIDKYTKHAGCAMDSQLKALFTGIAGTERKHLEMLTQIEGGMVPVVDSTDSPLPTFKAKYSQCECSDKSNDCYLCTDLLSTEKHASHLYDTCIFEFTDTGVRKALAHIQKEEQQHGKCSYDYMATNCMY